MNERSTLGTIPAIEWKSSGINDVHLKGQLHEIFDPRFFFHQSTSPMALIHGLKPFRIWLRIRRANRFESRLVKMKSRIPQFFLELRYGIRIFPYEIVLQDIPLKKVVVPKRPHLNSNIVDFFRRY
jgi:hypothetical protein